MSRKNPYVGPRSFQRTEEDEANFFGRPREVERLLNLLIAERIVLLHSPSGAGKTSLVNAGLIPELVKEQFDVLPVMRVNRFLPPDTLKEITVPNRYVFSALLSLEEYEEAGAKHEISWDRLKELAVMKFGEYLDRELAAKDKPIVLIFDQFEEILTSNPTDFPDKLEFFQQVGTALRDDNRWALFSMREDYVASLGSLLRPMPTRLSTRFKLELLTRKWAAEAIEKPAKKNVIYDKEVVDKLIDDLATVKVSNYDGTGMTTEVVGDFVEPMQLQVVCLRLWDNLTFPEDPKQKVQVKLTDLKSTHVDSSLAAFYEKCLAEVAESQTERDEAEIRQWIQDKLITSGGTRGLVFMGEDQAEGMPRKVVEELEQRHLLRSEQRGGSRWVELTHDRFIKPIEDSNRPWLSLRGLDRKTRRARVVAFSLFLVLVLFWVFLEWFMIKPFRDSQRFWTEVNAVHALQEHANKTQMRVKKAIDGAANGKEELRNEAINETKSDLEAALKQPQARRHGKGKLRKSAQLLVRGARKFEAVSNQTFDWCRTNNCSALDTALQHLQTDSENNWKVFTLSDADAAALLGAISDSYAAVNLLQRFTGLEQGSNNNSGQTAVILSPGTKALTDGTKASINFEKWSPVQDFVRKLSDPKKQQSLKEISAEVEKKLTEAGKKIHQASQEKQWGDYRLGEELRAVEEAVQFDLKTFLDPLKKYEAKNERRSDWLNEKEKQIKEAPWTYKGSWKYKALSPLYTVGPSQVTTLLYALWCFLLVSYIAYLANAMGGAEQVVFGLDLTHTRVDISDALGWGLTYSIPPVITIVAMCSLLLIHLRATWLVYDALIVSSTALYFGILTVMPLIAAFYYVSRRFMFARSLQRRELEQVQSAPAIVSPKPI